MKPPAYAAHHIQQSQNHCRMRPCSLGQADVWPAAGVGCPRCGCADWLATVDPYRRCSRSGWIRIPLYAPTGSLRTWIAQPVAAVQLALHPSFQHAKAARSLAHLSEPCLLSASERKQNEMEMPFCPSCCPSGMPSLERCCLMI